MTYKETLLFIGKCLTISHEEKNLKIVSEKIISKQIDWDAVVKVSTQHYVFPALYGNLKRAELLSHLPEDLVSYMKYITDLNRDRNLQIIEQAKEVNDVLVNHGITPIFLKGTGFLLQDFYIDIAERMVGDIDFIVDEKQFRKTVNILINDGYIKPKKRDNSFFSRHFPKMVKPNKISSVEVHHRMTIKSQNNFFNYEDIKDSLITIKGVTFLSIENQLLLTCINKQINNKGFWLKNVSFRNEYDMYLLSKKCSTINSLTLYRGNPDIINTHLSSISFFFNYPKSIEYNSSKKTNSFLSKQLYYLEHQKHYKINQKKWKFYFSSKENLLFLFRSIYKKQYRNYFFHKILNNSQ